MGWTEAYRVSTRVVSAVAYELLDEDASALAAPMQDLLNDVKGASEVRESLDGVLRTDFQREQLERVLTATGKVTEWRAGEALAEYHLATEENCFFPWPSGRDSKNPGSSSGGVDLIGFDISETPAAFALAEVKTSRQLAWPPQVLTGRHGLEKQLEGLRDGDDRKTWAIRYISMHAIHHSWHGTFQQAMVRYLDDTQDVRLFGTLIHVTDPNSLDLQARATNLSVGCPSKTRIKLTAIYLTGDHLATVAGAQVEWETSQ